MKADYDIIGGTRNHSEHSIYELKEAFNYQGRNSGSLLVHQEPIFDLLANAPDVVHTKHRSPLLHAPLYHRIMELETSLNHKIFIRNQNLNMLNAPMPANERHSMLSRHRKTSATGLSASRNPWIPSPDPLIRRLSYNNVSGSSFESIADRNLSTKASLSLLLSALPGAISSQYGYARPLQVNPTKTTSLKQITTRTPCLSNESSAVGRLLGDADFVDDSGGKRSSSVLSSTRNHLSVVEAQAQEAEKTTTAWGLKDEFQGTSCDTSGIKIYGSPPRSRKIRARTFAMKLMDSIINRMNDDVVAWVPDGKSFVIVDRDRFMKEIHPYSFKDCKYESFIRKLNQWNFMRSTFGSGVDCFTHELFQRDRIDLVLELRCHDWRIRRT